MPFIALQFIVAFLCIQHIHAVWQGAFEVSDAWCMPCNNVNFYTGSCMCTAESGYETVIRIINDCSGGLHGADIGFCSNSTGTDGFLGVFQVDDNAVCYTVNPFTGACTCPDNTVPISYRALTDNAGVIIGSDIIACYREGLGATPSFGGMFQEDDGGSCRVANPYTQGCSCPAGLTGSLLRVIADGPVGSNIVTCGQAPGMPGTVELCPGIFADASGNTDATDALMTCITTFYNQVLEIPPGVYAIDGLITITQPIHIGTAGTFGQPDCYQPEMFCATFRATPAQYNPNGFGGFIQFFSPDIVIDHIIVDGNRQNRLNTQAYKDCTDNYHGRAAGANAAAYNCNNCSFSNCIFMNAICGSGFGVNGVGITMLQNTYRGNGDHSCCVSDGMTVGSVPFLVVAGCNFIDNTDINLIIGNAPDGQIYGNTIAMMSARAFGGFMMDNFNGSTNGNYENLQVFKNSINCGNNQCSFGMEIGPHPWYLSPNIYGGVISQNIIQGANVNINVYGAGTSAMPTAIFGNQVGLNVPAEWQTACGYTSPGSVMNIAPDSTIFRNGEDWPVTNYEYHCA